jgi:hypothetical protein
VATNGSDANPCSSAAPCKTLDRAYKVAQPGQIVQLAGGTYPKQTIAKVGSRTSPSDVVFKPASGANVIIGRVVISASHLELQGVQTGWKVDSSVDDVTFRNVKADSGIYISGASNISVIGGEVYSPVPVSTDSMISSWNGRVPTNILIDGVTFHDWLDVGPGQANHIECLQVGSGINLTIRNSTFRNCATHDIFIKSWGTLNGNPHPLQQIVIENNWFGKTTAGFYALTTKDDLWTASPTSFLLRNNSSLQGWDTTSVTHGTITVTGNILDSMSSYTCSQSGGAAVWNYNLYETGSTCGPNDRVGNAKYENRAALDLDLLSGSAAIDKGNPSNYPSTDRYGRTRPRGAGPDMGAVEF